MFEGIKSFIRNTRIKFDYPRYEKEQSDAHSAEAERRFNIGQLQREVSKIKDQASQTGDQRFHAEITTLRKQITALEQDILRTHGQLSILERDYKSELDDLYVRKKLLLQIKEELLGEMKLLQGKRSQAQDCLKKAHEDLKEAKNDVDRWYRKAERTPWLFGNGGKKLPEHSPFGQSFGDLEAAKTRRGSAVHKIQEFKYRIVSIKEKQAENKRERELKHREIGEVCDKIAAAKESRQQMFNLRNEGVRLDALQQKLREFQSSQSDLTLRLVALEKQRSALVEETECRLGLRERQASIADLLYRKARFIDEFNSEQNKVIRKERHRRQWLASH